MHERKEREASGAEGPEQTRLEDLVRDAERHLAARAHDSAPDVLSAPGPDARAADELAGLMRDIDAQVRETPAEARRLAARLDRVRAGYALQMRAVPEDALEGLYDDVRSSLRSEDAWLRAGMSDAFLDAPRNLLMWRRVALTACLLLAVGAGYQLRGGSMASDSRSASQGRELQISNVLGVSGTPGNAPRGLGAGHSPAPAEQASFGSPGARRVPTHRGGWGQHPALRGGSRRGVYVFQQGAAAPADAGRMLDRIQIFPVPGREIVEGEDN